MAEDPGNLIPHRPKHPLAGALGGDLGGATGLAVGKLISLIGFESFWLGAVLHRVRCCTVYLAVARKD